MSFEVYTNHNKEAGIKSVQVGYKKPILETEFNEIQEIQLERLRRVVSEYLGEGILNKGTFTYSGGVFTISDETVIVDGEVIKISSLSITTGNGTSVYLDTWVEEVNTTSTLKKEGNQQESVVSNYLMDSRLGVETSRRKALLFNLSTMNNVSGHKYLKLGSISAGLFVQEVPVIGKPLYYHKGTQPPKVNKENTIWIDTST